MATNLAALISIRGRDQTQESVKSAERGLIGAGFGPVAWASTEPRGRALLDLSGLLPLAPETLDGLMWMEDGASEALNAERTSQVGRFRLAP